MIRWLWNLLISVDQFFNVLLSPLLNMLVAKSGARFGHPDETLSSVMGKNSRTKTCTVCTWICRHVLHPIDPNHCEESIEQDRGG